MSEYILSGCSTADLTKEHFLEREIHYICFHYEMDGKQYLDDLGESMSSADFYRAMQDGADTRTSQVNAVEYEEFFEPFLKEGKDILHVCLSSGISGSYNSANIAKEMLAERYPDRKIYVVDSLAASSGFGLLLDKMADLRDDGMGIDELFAWANENKRKLHHWFFSTDLTFFIKGGRVSKTAGIVGTILGICPLLDVNTEGKLIARQKVRTKRKVMAEIVNKMVEHAENGVNYSGKCYMCNSACLDDAKQVAEMIKEKFPNLNGDVLINNIGTTLSRQSIEYIIRKIIKKRYYLRENA